MSFTSAFNAASGLIGPAMSWFGSELQNRRAADAAENAQQFSAQQFASRYQTTTADMMAAGLNPMLAYQQGGGSPPTGVLAPVPANSGHNAAQTLLASQMNRAQIDNVEADTQNKRAQSGLIEAQIGATGASADQSRANIGLMEHQSKKIAEEIKNVPLEGNKLVELAKQLSQSADLLRKQGLTQDQMTNQIRELARKTLNEADLSGLDVEAALKFDNVGRDFGQFKPFLDIVVQLLRARR
ncbi:MAG: DNA pilot protein [Microvirus sp.]|nr:MAG: DNA pilot protein [Microvirus sp.]